MDSQRQLRYARLLQRDLGDIFQHDMKHHFGKAFITVTQVRVSPDLGVANVYLSLMLVKDTRGMIDSIEEKAKIIRQELGRRIRNQVRVVPELRFFLDDTAAYAARMDELMSKIDIPPDTDEPKE